MTMTMNFNNIIDPNDPFDRYLDDPRLSVSQMIVKYNIDGEDSEMKKQRKNLRCVVCEAKAFGYNFDRITCESCKAFFRRNALRNQNEFHCRYAGHCSINPETRRHCAACRIRKCFAVGMKKEWIRSEEEKNEKRLQLQVTRRRKRRDYDFETHEIIQPALTVDLSRIKYYDRDRLNNLVHCYDQYTGDPCLQSYSPPDQLVQLPLDQFFNRKKSIVVHFIDYFKHIPEFQSLHIDDQVNLIKQNLRLLLPLNYAILKTPIGSKFSYTQVQTIGCVNNIDLHRMFTTLSSMFVQFVKCDPMIMKLFILVLFFNTNPLTTSSVYDFKYFQQQHTIHSIQSSYMELFWVYLVEKFGETQAIHLYSHMITKYLYIQIVMEQIDSIIRMNDRIEYLDALLRTVLQLT